MSNYSLSVQLCSPGSGTDCGEERQKSFTNIRWNLTLSVLTGLAINEVPLSFLLQRSSCASGQNLLVRDHRTVLAHPQPDEGRKENMSNSRMDGSGTKEKKWHSMGIQATLADRQSNRVNQETLNVGIDQSDSKAKDVSPSAFGTRDEEAVVSIDHEK
jgi:hypothetical protein